MFDSLSKGNNPDRMKGALYVLGNKGTSECVLPITTTFTLKDLIGKAAYIMAGMTLGICYR